MARSATRFIWTGILDRLAAIARRVLRLSTRDRVPIPRTGVTAIDDMPPPQTVLRAVWEDFIGGFVERISDSALYFLLGLLLSASMLIVVVLVLTYATWRP